jgi:chloramphenicol 3-O-phosphotransferase
MSDELFKHERHSLPRLTTVPRDLYYHEVAYVRGLEADNERLTEYRALHPYSEVDMDMHVEAVTKDLRTQLADTAAFLDGLAERLDDIDCPNDKAAAECRARAERLRK